ncbi:MAG TPA: hypothetical protein VMS17_19860 [Gemmataceae bacterium]|nr:hypothetical protein [Gemmataceae bacterium]
MQARIRRFWQEEAGSAVVGDWVFVATILVLGAVAGAAALRTHASAEADDSALPAAAAASSTAHH